MWVYDGEGTCTTLCICGIGHCSSGNNREGFEKASPKGLLLPSPEGKTGLTISPLHHQAQRKNQGRCHREEGGFVWAWAE